MRHTAVGRKDSLYEGRGPRSGAYGAVVVRCNAVEQRNPSLERSRESNGREEMNTARLRRPSLFKVVLVTVAALLAVCLLALAGLEKAAEATFPGVNGKIAFQSKRDGNWEIYVMNPGGTNPTRLTNNPAWEGDPTLSPDGKRVAFVS